jgi:uncharacterized protein DUF6804
MHSRIVKWMCLAALILAAALRLDEVPRILLQFVVCGGAAFVMIEAARNRKYLWAAAFALVALYFNPVLPIALSRSASLPVVLLCALAFLGSVRYLRPVPKMSLATITDLPARGESL